MAPLSFLAFRCATRQTLELVKWNKVTACGRWIVFKASSETCTTKESYLSAADTLDFRAMYTQAKFLFQTQNNNSNNNNNKS